MEKKKIKPANYWNVKENCIEDARKYNTRTEWRKNSRSAYESARKNKWLDECCKHMVNGNIKWTKENCIKDARKYKSRKEWSINSCGAYESARKNKWLDECCKHMKEIIKSNNSWTKENCIKDARKYNTKSEWRKNSGSAYHSAWKNKWLDECCKHMILLGNRYKRMVYCYVFPDKSCYVGLTCNEERRKNAHLNNIKSNSPVFNYIKKTNLIPEYIKISDYVIDVEAQKIESDTIDECIKNGYSILNTRSAGALGANGLMWTKERCIENARKYKSISEWKKNSSGAYHSAWKNKWLDECCKHMNTKIKKPANYWNIKENCIEDARKYNTKSEWEKNSRGAYESARKNKWLDECCEHMKERNSWTKEKCVEDANKYKSRKEWYKKSGSAYQSARKNKWLDECFPSKELIESLEMV